MLKSVKKQRWLRFPSKSQTFDNKTTMFKVVQSCAGYPCYLGATDSEDIVHMLLDCPALFAQRKQYFGDLRSLIVNCVGIKQWESTFNTKENIVRLILDCSSFACLNGRK